MSQFFKTGVIVSKGNSTSTPLAANATFIGTTDDVTSYEEIDINVAGSLDHSPGSLYFEFSPDGINWDVSILVGGAPLSSPTIVPQHLRVVLPFFRVRFVNGNVDQTSFRLTVVYHRVSGTRLTRYLNQQLDNSEGIAVTRSVIDGYRVDGYYVNLLASNDNHLIVDGYIQNFPSQQHVIVDGYVQTNPNVNVINFPNDVHVMVDGYVQTNPVVQQGTSPWIDDITDRAGRLLGHVSVDGYVQTNPNVNVNNFPSVQAVQPVRSSTSNDTSVAASATNVTLLSSNTNRLGASVWNDSTTATLYLKLGTTASTSSYTVQVFPSGYYEVPFGYTGQIDGIWSAAVGNARISELT